MEYQLAINVTSGHFTWEPDDKFSLVHNDMISCYLDALVKETPIKVEEMQVETLQPFDNVEKMYNLNDSSLGGVDVIGTKLTDEDPMDEEGTCPSTNQEMESTTGDHVPGSYKGNNVVSTGANSSTSKRHKCSLCEKRFHRKWDFNIHMRFHNNEKPFSCSHCDKRFTQKGDLKRHVLTHTGHKPFTCTVCDVSFTRRVTWSHTR